MWYYPSETLSLADIGRVNRFIHSAIVEKYAGKQLLVNSAHMAKCLTSKSDRNLRSVRNSGLCQPSRPAERRPFRVSTDISEVRVMVPFFLRLSQGLWKTDVHKFNCRSLDLINLIRSSCHHSLHLIRVMKRFAWLAQASVTVLAISILVPYLYLTSQSHQTIDITMASSLRNVVVIGGSYVGVVKCLLITVYWGVLFFLLTACLHIYRMQPKSWPVSFRQPIVWVNYTFIWWLTPTCVTWHSNLTSHCIGVAHRPSQPL